MTEPSYIGVQVGYTRPATMVLKENYRGPSGEILRSPRVKIDEALAGLRALFEREGASFAYLFRSYARGEAGPAADVDIAVYVEHKRERLYSSFCMLCLGIRGVLGTKRFHFLLSVGAPFSRQFEVVSEGRLLLYRDEEKLSAFEVNVIRKYQGHRPPPESSERLS